MIERIPFGNTGHDEYPHHLRRRGAGRHAPGEGRCRAGHPPRVRREPHRYRGALRRLRTAHRSLDENPPAGVLPGHQDGRPRRQGGTRKPRALARTPGRRADRPDPATQPGGTRGPEGCTGARWRARRAGRRAGRGARALHRRHRTRDVRTGHAPREPAAIPLRLRAGALQLRHARAAAIRPRLRATARDLPRSWGRFSDHQERRAAALDRVRRGTAAQLVSTYPRQRRPATSGPLRALPARRLPQHVERHHPAATHPGSGQHGAGVSGGGRDAGPTSRTSGSSLSSCAACQTRSDRTQGLQPHDFRARQPVPPPGTARRGRACPVPSPGTCTTSTRATTSIAATTPAPNQPIAHSSPYRWHATSAPPRDSSSGRSVRHRSIALGHRG